MTVSELIEKPEYDPERALWMPSRRKFFLLGLAAGVAPFLPDVPAPNPRFSVFSVETEITDRWAWERTMTALYVDGRNILTVPIHLKSGERLLLDGVTLIV